EGDGSAGTGSGESHCASPFVRRTTLAHLGAGLLTSGSPLPPPFPGSLDGTQWFRRDHSPVTVARPCRTHTGFPLRGDGIRPSRLRPPPEPPAGAPSTTHLRCAGESTLPTRPGGMLDAGGGLRPSALAGI